MGPLPILPPIYTVRCVADRWFIEAPLQDGPHQHAPYRQQLNPRFLAYPFIKSFSVPLSLLVTKDRE